MAMIFQTFALYPHLPVRENLAYPLREAKVAAGEARHPFFQLPARAGIDAAARRRGDLCHP